MTNTEIIANLATIIAKQNLEISELNTEVQHLHHELLARMNEADRKTENCSEKPNNCDTCIHNKLEWYSEVCDGCSKAHSNYEPKDEPQMGDAKPIPLSNRVTHIEDVPQTDCAWGKDG